MSLFLSIKELSSKLHHIPTDSQDLLSLRGSAIALFHEVTLYSITSTLFILGELRTLLAFSSWFIRCCPEWSNVWKLSRLARYLIFPNVSSYRRRHTLSHLVLESLRPISWFTFYRAKFQNFFLELFCEIFIVPFINSGSYISIRVPLGSDWYV